jgi:hypothetical protein
LSSSSSSSDLGGKQTKIRENRTKNEKIIFFCENEYKIFCSFFPSIFLTKLTKIQNTVSPLLFNQGLNKSCKSLVICCLAILQARNVKFILKDFECKKPTILHPE